MSGNLTKPRVVECRLFYRRWLHDWKVTASIFPRGIVDAEGESIEDLNLINEWVKGTRYVTQC